MVNLEDFIIKGGNKNIDFSKLYLDKIEKFQKRNLRLLENVNSNIIKKFVRMHEYLNGIGSTACNMTKENYEKGDRCKFCSYLVDEINKTENEHFNWLKTLDIVNLVETDKFNKEIIKVSKDSVEKIILKNGKVFEKGKTFESDIVESLNEEQKKIHTSMVINKRKIEGKLAKAKFFAPVYDYATDEVKIFEFGPAVFNSIENTFTKAGYEYTSADFIITHNAVQGNWWPISKKDSSPIPPNAIAKYELIKSAIINEIERKTKMPTIDEQKVLFNKFKTALDKKNEINPEPEVTSEDPKKTDLDLF